jgi:glucokinase
MKDVVAGVDLGGTSIKLAIADSQGSLLFSQSIDTESHRGPSDVIERIAQSIERMLANIPAAKLAAVGVGVPGLVDTKSGVTKFLPNLWTQWREIAVGSMLTERLGCPVRLLNDASTATLGELRFGHGKDLPGVTMAFFSIGTGIGGGVVIDGTLRLGPIGAAGELGHQTMVADGLLCGCGNLGCLETLASGAALVAEGVRLLKCGLALHLSRLTHGDLSAVSPKLMAEAATEDPAVMQTIQRAANYIGIAAANVVSILHPDVIVFGGGVSEMGAVLLEPVARVVHQRVRMFPTDGVRIERSILGDQAGIVGAIALALEHA